MHEFRFHGRGGQGVVILSRLVGRLYFQQGSHVKEFPKFGVERRGAPVEGYVRVDNVAIDLYCQVENPNAVVVMAESILDTADVTSGMEAGGLVLVSSGRPPLALADRLRGFKVATIDAGRVALAHGLGTALAPVTNTTLLGAFARILGIDFSEVDVAVRSEIRHSADANVAAARDAYQAVSLPELLPGEPIRRAAPVAPFESLDDLPLTPYSVRDARANRTGSWRSQRPAYVLKMAPCNAKCPAGNDVRGFLEALANDEPQRALEILLETTPLPGVCGRVCPHPCEAECNRESMDGRVKVMALERFAEAHGGAVSIGVAADTGRRVAIVGAGPAGLSAAWQLARLGHRVKIYEAAEKPGGMLLLGIPAYRLPRDVLERELDRIVSVGVEILCNTRVGEQVDLAVLQSENDAVLLAIGKQLSAHLKMPGEEKAVYGLPFLRRHNLGDEVEVGTEVVVVGGGNTAVDCAGVAMRLSETRNVKIVYRRSRSEMPAIPEEVDQALAEGVELIELTSPVELITGDSGAVVALAAEKIRLEAAEKGGRPRPVPIPGSRFEISCDQVIVAAGQRTDLGFEPGLALGGPEQVTNRQGVLVAGDAHDGAGTVAAAIGSGRRAGLAIHAALGGALPKAAEPWAPCAADVLRADRINRTAFARQPPAEAARLSVQERLASFDEVVAEMPSGCAEARRCMSCGSCSGCDRCYVFCPEPAISRQDGVYRIDLDYCKGCGICFEECPRGVVDLLEERL